LPHIVVIADADAHEIAAGGGEFWRRERRAPERFNPPLGFVDAAVKDGNVMATSHQMTRHGVPHNA
jgi:hypothetical protein